MCTVFVACPSLGGPTAAACLGAAAENYADACASIPALSLGSSCVHISLLANSAAVLFGILTMVLPLCGKDARASIVLPLDVCSSLCLSADQRQRAIHSGEQPRMGAVDTGRSTQTAR